MTNSILSIIPPPWRYHSDSETLYLFLKLSKLFHKDPPDELSSILFF